jgi:hypothetical protein
MVGTLALDSTKLGSISLLQGYRTNDVYIVVHDMSTMRLEGGRIYMATGKTVENSRHFYDFICILAPQRVLTMG